jgi:DNA-directed RNA polymerase subunit RPC12/RpoP
MRINDYDCNRCGKSSELLLDSNEPPRCSHCQSLRVTKRITFPKAYIMRQPNTASVTPRKYDHAEPRRREAKHERVTTMLERQGLGDKNKTDFVDPKKARRR